MDRSILRKLRWFVHARDRWLAVEAILLLWLVRLMLWVLPYRRWQQAVKRWTVVSGGQPEQTPPQLSVVQVNDRLSFSRRIGRIVVAASGYVPRATCLPQAISAQIMLARRGVASDLQIGVLLKQTDGTTQPIGKTSKLLGHAWLRVEGKIIIGDLPDIGHYTVMPIRQ
jgi:hypothetical protein